MGFSAGVYWLGVHFGPCCSTGRTCDEGFEQWARLLIFAVLASTSRTGAEQVSATIHLARFVVGAVLSAAVLRAVEATSVAGRGPRVAGRSRAVDLRSRSRRGPTRRAATWLSGGDVTDCPSAASAAWPMVRHFSCRDATAAISRGRPDRGDCYSGVGRGPSCYNGALRDVERAVGVARPDGLQVMPPP